MTPLEMLECALCTTRSVTRKDNYRQTIAGLRNALEQAANTARDFHETTPQPNTASDVAGSPESEHDPDDFESEPSSDSESRR